MLHNIVINITTLSSISRVIKMGWVGGVGLCRYRRMYVHVIHGSTNKSDRYGDMYVHVTCILD